MMQCLRIQLIRSLHRHSLDFVRKAYVLKQEKLCVLKELLKLILRKFDWQGWQLLLGIWKITCLNYYKIKIINYN